MIATRRLALALLRLLLLYALFCFLILALGLEIRQRQEAGWGLASPLPAPTLQPPFLGINIELMQTDAATRRADLPRLRSVGFGWARQRFDWGLIEPQPGQFVWTQSDALLHDLHDAGLQPVVVLDGSPAWARRPQDQANPLAPPADPTTFARFAAAFAQRYHARVTYYQIWDEPNIAPHWGHRHIEPVDYAQFLRVTATAIRSADPTALILTAALAPTRDRGHTAIDEPYFLQRLYAAGAADVFDAVAVQPFGFGAAPNDPRERIDLLNFQRIKLVRRIMLAAGDGATPIWAVRFGWNTRPNSPWGTVSPTDQRIYTQEALSIGDQQWPWLAAMGWIIDQPGRPVDDPLWGFALTPDLERAIRNWVSGIHLSTRQYSISNPQSLDLPLLVIALLMLCWRVYAAARLVPWSTWRDRYRGWPVGFRLLIWVGLLIFYYVATWPPLIGLCWLLAAILLAAQPQIGLYLAALLLPLHDHHKEIQLVDRVWAIAPAHASLFCLMPGLLIQLYKNSPPKKPGGRGHKRESCHPGRVCLPSSRVEQILTRMTKIVEGVSQYLLSVRRTAATYRVTPLSLRYATFLNSFWKSRLLFDYLAVVWLILNLSTSLNVWYWPAYGQGLLSLALAPLLFYGSVRILITTPTHWRYLATALGLSGLLVALLGLIAWSQGQGVAVDGVLRLAGPYYSPNQAALYLERTVGLGVGLAFASAAQQRWGWWASITVLVAALLLTASRGAWLLALPAGVALWLWWRAAVYGQRLGGSGSRRNAAIILASASLLISAASAAIFGERLANSATILSRFQIWRTTLALWQDQPWLGVGPGGFYWRYPAYLTQPTVEPNLYHPHNLWLEFAASWGLLGLVWLGMYLIGLWRWRTVAQSDPISLGLLLGLVAGLAHAQVDAFATLPDLAGWNWLALALLVQKTRVMPLEHDPDQTDKVIG